MFKIHLWVSLFAVLLSACANGVTTPSRVGSNSPTVADVSPTVIVTSPSASAELSSTDADQYANLAKQDLSNRLKINIAQITLQKSMEITWPYVSAGCTPGVGQVLTKGRVYGYRVWLEAEGRKYIYHVGLTGQVILCPTLNPGANNPLLMTPDNSKQDFQSQTP